MKSHLAAALVSRLGAVGALLLGVGTHAADLQKRVTDLEQRVAELEHLLREVSSSFQKRGFIVHAPSEEHRNTNAAWREERAKMAAMPSDEFEALLLDLIQKAEEAERRWKEAPRPSGSTRRATQTGTVAERREALRSHYGAVLAFERAKKEHEGAQRLLRLAEDVYEYRLRGSAEQGDLNGGADAK